MQPAEQHNVDVVLRYFDGCNTGDLDDLLPTLAADVVHYFLPESLPTIRGSEHLARFWAKYKRTLDPTWRIDQIIVAGDLVVSEWSCRWRPSETDPWVMTRGTEWYVMRDGVIAEIRGYSAVDGVADSELEDFPYAERGYLPRV
jgi:ketosteroid isomerase-like protein